MANKFNPNAKLKAGLILFKDGTRLNEVNCYITDRFLVVNRDDAATLYNLDLIDSIERAEVIRKKQCVAML